MTPFLYVHIPAETSRSFYSLYVLGCYGTKTPIPDGTEFSFPPSSILILYYTYPTHRRAYIVRFTGNAGKTLPGLSLPVTVLSTVYASRVDKLKKTISHISEHLGSPLSMPDIFYRRLDCILQQRGKVNYESIRSLWARQKEELDGQSNNAGNRKIS